MVMNEVVVVIGAGSIGQAIARRVSTGKHVVLADLRPQAHPIRTTAPSRPQTTRRHRHVGSCPPARLSHMGGTTRSSFT
jgi:NAD(P)-dependent dehydrogenase (short-subunit alcohol dehydrogenase family)